VAEGSSAIAPGHETVAQFHLVAIASSAGGLQALREVLSGLPDDFPAAVLIVQHLDPKHPSHIAEIMTRYTKLRVSQAEDGQKIVPAEVLFAPPGRHLKVTKEGRVKLTDTALIHFVRPSADLLFQSAAECFQQRCIAVVLTGTGKDGADGLSTVKRMGGIVIAQDEGSSEFFGMPKAASETGAVDFVLPLAEISSRLASLVSSSNE
jgi:two-component system, chemotaxis family, protein-glutamate methylesterase/glutaminase